MPGVLEQARKRGVLLAAACAVLAGGCEGAPARSKNWRHQRAAEQPPRAEPPADEAVATRERRPNTLRIQLDAAPRHLHPMVQPTVAGERITRGTVFETLVRYEPPADGHGPGRYQPGLAERWTVSPREIRIELREGATFHDGTRVTSVDVQFSLDAARSKRVGADHLRAMLADVSSVDIAGPRTVRVRLERWNGYALRALAEVPILPQDVYRKRMDASRGPVVGSGPFRVASWTDQLVRLERYDGYWGEPAGVDAVEFVVDGDAASALTAAKRGELDVIPALIDEHYPEQASAPAIAGSFVGLRLRPVELRFAVVNHRVPPFDDTRVRRAVALLVDRGTIVKKVHGSLARPATGAVWPGGPGDAGETTELPYDPVAAARLLDAAGWRDADGDGIRERDGERLHIVVLALPGSGGDERDIIVKSLRRSGFFVELRRGPDAVLLARMAEGAFHLGFVEWHTTVDADLSAVFGTGGAMNYGGFSDPRVDAVLDRLRATTEPAERVPVMNELAALLADLMPIIPITVPDPYGLVHERVRNWQAWNGWLDLARVRLMEP